MAHASCTCSQQPLPFSNERRSQFWTYGKANPFSHDLMLTYVERLRIIEIRPKVWKTFVLPLYYSRMFGRAYHSPVQEGGEQLSCGPSRYNATKKETNQSISTFLTTEPEILTETVWWTRRITISRPFAYEANALPLSYRSMNLGCFVFNQIVN